MKDLDFPRGTPPIPSRLDQWLTVSVPRGRLSALKRATGAYAVLSLLAQAHLYFQLTNLTRESFAPVGVLSLLESPLPTGVLGFLYVATVGLGISFAKNARSGAMSLLFALALLLLTTYRSCWGMIFHTDNLLVLHVGLLALDPIRGQREEKPLCSGAILHALQLVTIASYLLAGFAKLSNSGWAWVLGESLQHQLAYDTVRKQTLGGLVSPLAPLIAQSPWLCFPASVFTLAVELLSPLALYSSRLARRWCWAAWLFHVGVLATMGIVFAFPLSGCAFLCFARPETYRWLRPRHVTP